MMAKRDRLARNPLDEAFSLWPSRPVLAAEIGATAAQVDKWAQTGRVPAEWQYWIVQSARAHNFDGVTPEWMLRHHAGFAKRNLGSQAQQ